MLAGMPQRNASNFHWGHEVYRLARERGCDVMLGGDYGNVSFSFGGEGSMPHWLTSGQWLRLWRELQYSRGKRWRIAALMTQAALPLMPRPIQLAVLRLAGRGGDRYRGWCPLREDYVKASGLEARSLALGYDPDQLGRPRSTRQLRTQLFTQGEAEGADGRLSFSELHQMPFRDPTAYRPLVEFCLGIPDDQYLRDGQQRWLARRMLRGMVPDMVVEEKRRGSQAADWYLRLKRERHALIQELDEVSTDPTLAKRIDFAGLRAALIDCPAETPLNSQEMYRLRAAVPRALTTARFVRYSRGTN
jgi:asparagine synthase (glutamine-hydrolysing)